MAEQKLAFSKSPSWIPIITALFVPPVVVYGLFAISQNINPDAWRDIAPPPVTSAVYAAPETNVQIALRLVDERDQPVVGRKVQFTHDPGQGQPRPTMEGTTDSAGFMTVTVPKVGNLTARIDGVAGEETLLNLQSSTRTTYNLTVVVTP